MQPRVQRATRKYIDFALVEDYPLRFSKAKGRRVECLSGVVWITAYNELSDYMLRAGEVFVIPNNGLTLIEAIGDCRVRIDLPNLFLHVLHRLLVLCGWDRLVLGANRLRNFLQMPDWLR
ncbi:MAG: DUF2917 domain-containing protein [Burkholderiaceae bacterium]|nr:DUF2917 domain-containing protein [Burkholderiaceae bacterium]